MEASQLMAEVSAAIAESFPGGRLVDFGAAPGGWRMGGTLVWDGFADTEPMDRQALLWRALRARISKDELRAVSLILTVTERELEAILAD